MSRFFDNLTIFLLFCANTGQKQRSYSENGSQNPVKILGLGHDQPRPQSLLSYWEGGEGVLEKKISSPSQYDKRPWERCWVIAKFLERTGNNKL